MTSHVHLALDPDLAHSVSGLRRQLHHAARHPRNPILVGDRPWERHMIECNGRAVLFDETRSRFRMWYVAAWLDETMPEGCRYLTCYAESVDGVEWERPELGQRDWRGSQTNQIRCGVRWMRRPNVIDDGSEADPARRFKMTYVDYPVDERVAVVTATSSDGLAWSASKRPWYRRQHNANLLGWHEDSGRYVFFPRYTEDGVQGVGRATSADFETWSDVTPAVLPGPGEEHLQFKGLAAFPYRDLYLGFLWVFHGDPRRCDAELVMSRDTVTWERLFPGVPFFARGGAGAWDRETVMPVAPVVRDGRVWIFYGGWNLPYTHEAMDRAADGWTEDGQIMQRAIGVATLPMDRFVSWTADSEVGELTSQPVVHAGGPVLINAAIRGSLRVGLLGEDGSGIEGCGIDECEPLSGDDLRHRPRWPSGDGHRLRGRSLRLCLRLQDGDLFAFGWEKESGRCRASPSG